MANYMHNYNYFYTKTKKTNLYICYRGYPALLSAVFLYANISSIPPGGLNCFLFKNHLRLNTARSLKAAPAAAALKQAAFPAER